MKQKRKPMSEETKDKIRQKNKIKIKEFFDNHPEAKLHLSQKNKGKHFSKKTEWKKGNKSWITGKTRKEYPQLYGGIWKKGNIPWNKDKEMSEETKKKMSLIMKQKMNNPKTKEKLSIANKKRYANGEILGFMKWKGKKLPEHIKLKMRKNHRKFNSEQSKQKMRENHKIKNFGLRVSRKYIVMPKKDTKIEVKIQNFLKDLNIEFFTHQYIKIEHGYQCDIFIPSLNFIIECDGNYWHSYPTGTEIDNIRTKELIEKGFKVLRLWEHEINSLSIEQFKTKLENAKN
jgi:very-short-patch-repair endonuclease